MAESFAGVADRLFVARKVRRYALASLALTFAGYGLRILLAQGAADALSRDFLCFWAVSSLSLAGDPGSAFDPQVLHGLQSALGSGEKFYTWSYPPTFQLLILPLGLAPPVVAQVVWVVAAVACFAFALERLLPRRNALLVVASSALFVTNAYLGQTGIWLAALYMIGLASLEDTEGARPWGAAAFGLAAIKPHLGLMVPVMLLFQRRLGALVVATAALLSLVLASLLAFGGELWLRFFDMAGTTMRLLEESRYSAHLLASFFSLCRSFGASNAAAYALHAAFVLGVVGSSLRSLRLSRDPLLSGAVAVCAGLLLFPYAYYYDLLLLAAPAVALAKRGLEGGWLAGEREALTLLWLGPFPLLLAMQALGLSLGVLFPLLTFWLLGRRLRRTRESEPVREPARSQEAGGAVSARI